MIKLGAFASDRIVNVAGVVTGRATYITGCDQYLVSPKSGDKEPRWIDEQRLVVDETIEVIELDNSNGNGATSRPPSSKGGRVDVKPLLAPDPRPPHVEIFL